MNSTAINIKFVTPLVSPHDPIPMNILIDGKEMGTVKWIPDQSKFMAHVCLDGFCYYVSGFGSTREEAVEDAACRGLEEAKVGLALAEQFAAKFE